MRHVSPWNRRLEISRSMCLGWGDRYDWSSPLVRELAEFIKALIFLGHSSLEPLCKSFTFSSLPPKEVYLVLFITC